MALKQHLVKSLLVGLLARGCFGGSAKSGTCSTKLAKKCLYGTALAKVAAASEAECCAACVALAGCQGWQFGASCKYCSPATPCVLKDAIPSAYDDNCTSGYPGGVPPLPPAPPAKPTPAPAPTPAPDRFAFATVLTGGAVLQHDEPAAVWGAGAAPGATVSLSLGGGGAVATAVADAAGGWSATLPPQPIRWNATLSATTSSATTTRGPATTNATSAVVSFGLVLLCSGQSNMAMPVSNKDGGFRADNGTAECAAAGPRYGGRVSLLTVPQAKYDHGVAHWEPLSSASLFRFSAVCWYSGKALLERLGGSTPIGLIAAAVGGSPIEYWLPPSATRGPNANACEADAPQCDNQYNDSTFFSDQIEQLLPYTLGAIVWDQAERDVKCPVSVGAYACMQRLLATSWRAAFHSPRAPFVAVQLPGYTAPLNNGTGSFNGTVSAEMVFAMRLQQEAGSGGGLANATVVATYDQSCALPAPDCPFGSVHNVQKDVIGARVAAALHKMLAADDAAVAEGPRATGATATRKRKQEGAATMGGDWDVSVSFAGGTAPFALAGTKNCTSCCDAAKNAHTLDFVLTGDGGASWVNATGGLLVTRGSVVTVSFTVTLPAAPIVVRYTAGAIFPQCALYNSEGFPALPFEMTVTSAAETDKGEGNPVLAAALAAATQSASTTSDLGCFVEKPSSSTVRNICERSYDAFSSAANAEACAEKCIADSTCVSFAFTSVSPQCRMSATCTAPTSAVPAFDGYFRNSTSGACASPPAPALQWRRVNLDAAAAKGAVCIDGSPGVFYIRTTNANGTAPANPNKWVLFMEGGGWTFSDHASVGRSKTDLGSSKNYPPGEHFDPGYEGSYMFQHAPYDDATIVYNKYCDGGSWTGALSNPPRVVENTTLYYRGRGLLDGIFDELYTNHSLSAAKEVTLSGCSAGGLTTYVHADAVAARVQARSPNAKTVAVADAMFSLDHDDFAKDGHWPRFMQWVYSNMDPSGASVNEACVVAMAAKYGVPAGNRSEGWRCMFGASIINYLATPTFVLNSKYDVWQGAQIIGAHGCTHNISSCPANVTQFWVDYGHSMVKLLDAMPVRHGAYVHNCQSHCQTGLSPDYDEDTVHDSVSGSSVNMGDAVNAWYVAAMAGKPETVTRHIDRCDVLPCAGDICHGIDH